MLRVASSSACDGDPKQADLKHRLAGLAPLRGADEATRH